LHYTITLMHELSIARNLIEMAETAARDAGASRVTRLRLELGQMSGVVSGALLFCFDVAAQGTLVEGAQLDIELLPVVVHCPACGQDSPLPSIQRFRCPRCNAPTADIVQGRELVLASIEVED
jgi:hydrogenase nickel incorporation protein HypA/HybF